MKYFFIIALLIGSSCAVLTPEQRKTNERFIDGIIIDFINSATQTIKDNGLDPLEFKREAGKFSLPVPELFTTFGYVEDILVTGLSNIRVNNIDFSILALRLNYDLAVPAIHVGIGRAYGEVSGFGEKGDGTIAGTVDIGTIRVVGRAQVSIGIISGISISQFSIDLTLAGIDSQLTTVEIFNRDLTAQVNNFLGSTLPEILDFFRADINQILEYFLLDLIESLLNSLRLAEYLQ